MYWSERFCDKWEKRCGASTGFSRSLFLFHSHDELTLSSDLFYPSGRTINFDFVRISLAFERVQNNWKNGCRCVVRRRQSTRTQTIDRCWARRAHESRYIELHAAHSSPPSVVRLCDAIITCVPPRLLSNGIVGSSAQRIYGKHVQISAMSVPRTWSSIFFQF